MFIFIIYFILFVVMLNKWLWSTLIMFLTLMVVLQAQKIDNNRDKQAPTNTTSYDRMNNVALCFKQCLRFNGRMPSSNCTKN